MDALLPQHTLLNDRDQQRKYRHASQADDKAVAQDQHSSNHVRRSQFLLKRLGVQSVAPASQCSPETPVSVDGVRETPAELARIVERSDGVGQLHPFL